MLHAKRGFGAYRGPPGQLGTVTKKLVHRVQRCLARVYPTQLAIATRVRRDVRVNVDERLEHRAPDRGIALLEFQNESMNETKAG